ncbi:unnamed protein product [Caenorhabditis sp. 36 PRJEB53466]|nr:unnamed protein product [Caenorhabditis sp. 36 PRJEB53466]
MNPFPITFESAVRIVNETCGTRNAMRDKIEIYLSHDEQEIRFANDQFMKNVRTFPKALNNLKNAADNVRTTIEKHPELVEQLEIVKATKETLKRLEVSYPQFAPTTPQDISWLTKSHIFTYFFCPELEPSATRTERIHAVQMRRMLADFRNGDNIEQTLYRAKNDVIIRNVWMNQGQLQKLLDHCLELYSPDFIDIVCADVYYATKVLVEAEGTMAESAEIRNIITKLNAYKVELEQKILAVQNNALASEVTIDLNALPERSDPDDLPFEPPSDMSKNERKSAEWYMWRIVFYEAAIRIFYELLVLRKETVVLQDRLERTHLENEVERLRMEVEMETAKEELDHYERVLECRKNGEEAPPKRAPVYADNYQWKLSAVGEALSKIRQREVYLNEILELVIREMDAAGYGICIGNTTIKSVLVQKFTELVHLYYFVKDMQVSPIPGVGEALSSIIRPFGTRPTYDYCKIKKKEYWDQLDTVLEQIDRLDAME